MSTLANLCESDNTPNPFAASSFRDDGYDAWLDSREVDMPTPEEEEANRLHCLAVAMERTHKLQLFLDSSKSGTPNRRLRKANILYRRNRDNAEYLIRLHRSHEDRYRRRLFAMVGR